MKKRRLSVLSDFLLFTFYFLLLSSCSIQKKIGKSVNKDVLDTKALQTAHVGISIFDPAGNKYWYNHQGDKYFVPASNIKIPTCYAAMKYLGDSLVGIRYGIPEEKMYSDKLIVLQPTGDPTLLHKDYSKHRVYDFFKNDIVAKNKSVGFMDTIWKDQQWGNGWSWNDYQEYYMAERNSLPVFGNIIEITLNNDQSDRIFERNKFNATPEYFDSLLNKKWQGEYFEKDKFSIRRKVSENNFGFTPATNSFRSQTITFSTHLTSTSFRILNYLLKAEVFNSHDVWPTDKKEEFLYSCPGCDIATIHIKNWQKIHSQPTDSLLKLMMHRSDNFFAEQSLLMVSNEKLGYMDDSKVIDTLLNIDFKDLPQKPRWADGSGLSRYNLFTPQDFVAILNKMKNEFGMERLKVILPTGGEGTISSYYKADSGYIYGKTGTLSGVVAFSGFMYTKKGKLLIFSTLVNNHQATSTDVRRAIEKFLQGVRNRF